MKHTQEYIDSHRHPSWPEFYWDGYEWMWLGWRLGRTP